MPLDYETFPPYVATQSLRRAYDAIDPSNGYNTRPLVAEDYVPMDDAPQCPFICLQPAVLAGDEQVIDGGPGETFTEDADFGLLVWGYFEDETSRERAMWALLCDILSATWEPEESHGDVVVGIDLIRARFDIAPKSTKNRGWLVVELRTRVLFDRGG